MRQSHNNRCNLPAADHYGPEKQDRTLARYPKVLREFLLYEAIGDYNLTSFNQMLRKVGAKQTVELARAKQKALARLTYGPDHPAAI